MLRVGLGKQINHNNVKHHKNAKGFMSIIKEDKTPKQQPIQHYIE